MWALVHGLHDVGILVEVHVPERPGRIVGDGKYHMGALRWTDSKCQQPV